MSIRDNFRQYLARKLRVPEIPFALERLNQIGFKPNQIFDVGAYKGDFARYCIDIWPQAKVACFDVLQDKVQQLQKLASENSAVSVFPVLLGAEAREQVPLNLAETASSVLVEHISNFSVEYYPMRTIDQIVLEKFAGQSPDFLKIDVQGYELEVLKGAEKSLPQIKAILAEINLLDIHQNVPLLAEIITWLNERDFVAYDICALTRRPLDQALWQADFLFVPRNSSLRADKRWGADN
jgi:FkbM family methyltransferase